MIYIHPTKKISFTTINKVASRSFEKWCTDNGFEESNSSEDQNLCTTHMVCLRNPYYRYISGFIEDCDTRKLDSQGWRTKLNQMMSTPHAHFCIGSHTTRQYNEINVDRYNYSFILFEDLNTFDKDIQKFWSKDHLFDEYVSLEKVDPPKQFDIQPFYDYVHKHKYASRVHEYLYLDYCLYNKALASNIHS